MKKTIILTSLITAVVMLFLVYGGFKAVHATGEYPFCGSCHEWDGDIALANVADDIHGHANPNGFSPTCTDCHLPHGSLVEYLVVKAKNGISEGWITLTRDPSKKDWLANREHARANYTFDSSCLRCHEGIVKLPEDKESFTKVNKMHAKYLEFKGTDDELKCTSCHKFVGHKNLGKMLFEKTDKRPSTWEEWDQERISKKN